MNDLIFKEREIGELGIDLYFYDARVLMIYKYEILYQLSEGLWSSSRYPQGHEIPWMKANLHLTKGKNNSRNVVEIGCNIVKNNYNLKKVLDIPTSYNRVKSIGKLSNVLRDDLDTLIILLNDEFYEVNFDVSDNPSQSDIDEAVNILRENGRSHSLMVLNEDILMDYLKCEYTDDMMRDDLGMIQNTMRNTMSLC